MNTRTESPLSCLKAGSGDTSLDREGFVQPPGWHPHSGSICHAPSLSSGRAASRPGTDWEPRRNSDFLLVRVSCPIQNLDSPPMQSAFPQTPNSRNGTLSARSWRAVARFRPANTRWNCASALPQPSTVHPQDNLRHSDASNAQNSADAARYYAAAVQNQDTPVTRDRLGREILAALRGRICRA